jgi:hypothetical protein
LIDYTSTLLKFCLESVYRETFALTDQGIQYKSAENSDQKMINYDDSADALFTDARSLQRQQINRH